MPSKYQNVIKEKNVIIKYLTLFCAFVTVILHLESFCLRDTNSNISFSIAILFLTATKGRKGIPLHKEAKLYMGLDG